MIAVVGDDCPEIEDRIDSYIILSGPGCFIATTSHPDETLEEVLEFARYVYIDKPGEPEVVKL